MNKKEIKLLKEELPVAINKELKDNKADVTKKIEMVLKKTVEQIVRRSAKQINKTTNNK